MLFGGFEVWIDFQRFAEISNCPLNLSLVHHSYTHVVSGKIICGVQLYSFFEQRHGLRMVPTMAYKNAAKSGISSVPLGVNLQGFLQMRYSLRGVRLTGSCQT